MYGQLGPGYATWDENETKEALHEFAQSLLDHYCDRHCGPLFRQRFWTNDVRAPTSDASPRAPNHALLASDDVLHGAINKLPFNT